SQGTAGGVEGAGLSVLLGLPVRVEQGVQRGRLLLLGQAVERSAADVQDVETLRGRLGQQLPLLVPQRLEGGHLRQRGGDLVERGQVTHAATSACLRAASNWPMPHWMAWQAHRNSGR